MFPRTRYQGSKARLVGWLRETFDELEFDTALDAFGGTGAVSYLLKSMGKQVTYNDVLACNRHVGVALIENAGTRLDEGDVARLLSPGPPDDDFIARTFRGIYYLPHEDAWLDGVTQELERLDDTTKRSLGFWALFQACLAKRPYNLFHRKNLELRTRAVARSFGNKVTWDRPFAEHFRCFVEQANRAVFCNGRDNRVLASDARDVPGEHDLVYLDPPYVPTTGPATDYHAFYHFLEGLSAYREWPRRIDPRSKHRAFLPVSSPWTDRRRVGVAFDELLERFSRSIVVLSYREDGVPSVPELEAKLRRHGRRVRIRMRPHRYALSRKRHTREVLLVADRERGATLKGE